MMNTLHMTRGEQDHMAMTITKIININTLVHNINVTNKIQHFSKEKLNKKIKSTIPPLD